MGCRVVWCWCVMNGVCNAGISSSKRWIAGRLYGELPTSTYAEALQHFKRAADAGKAAAGGSVGTNTTAGGGGSSGGTGNNNGTAPWLLNNLWLAKALTRGGLLSDASSVVRDSLNITPVTPDDMQVRGHWHCAARQ
jgi:hypothetical protein